MDFDISQVRLHTVHDGDVYFLDSNIWIDILSPRNNPEQRHLQYRKLFEEIINNSKVRIALPALVVSEVLNRVLREVYMTKYARKNGYPKDKEIPSGYYKEVYRKTEDFQIRYNTLCDDLRSYHSSIDLISDHFGDSIKWKHVLKDPPQGLDFNDYYYYNLCKNNGYIIVTDDKDFWVSNVKILTQSKTLIEKQNNLTGKMALEKVKENNNSPK